MILVICRVAFKVKKHTKSSGTIIFIDSINRDGQDTPIIKNKKPTHSAQVRF